MHQNWGKLLFMHWRIRESLLRPLIPAPLEIDTFDGSAWIAIAPFTMWDIRALPPFIPALPGLSALHEMNVRTYVHLNRVPGVWFFSLDASSAAAVLAARTFFFLPYYHAQMELTELDGTIDYSSVRLDEPKAEFQARWSAGKKLALAEPESLEFFLTERYSLFSAREETIYRARIFHEPWPLCDASLNSFSSTMIEACGLPTPAGDPLLLYCEKLEVDIWPLQKMETST